MGGNFSSVLLQLAHVSHGFCQTLQVCGASRAEYKGVPPDLALEPKVSARRPRAAPQKRPEKRLDLAQRCRADVDAMTLLLTASESARFRLVARSWVAAGASRRGAHLARRRLVAPVLSLAALYF